MGISLQVNEIYNEVGSPERLREILDSFYKAMERDVMIGFFFTGKDLNHIINQQRDFLLRAWGVTSQYQGKSPAVAHIHLPQIRRGQFDRRLVILREILNEFKLKPDVIEMWIKFEDGFRKIIVK